MYPGRTTTSEVSALIEVDDTIDLTQFIDMANELTTEACDPYYLATTPPAGFVPATPPPGYAAYTAHRLLLIERMLSAHFYTVRDPRTSHEHVGPLSVSYQGKIDLGLDSSIYGQNAMRLDTRGGLALMNNRMKKTFGSINLPAGVYHLGTSPRRGRRCL